jgi:hypothetical protein
VLLNCDQIYGSEHGFQEERLLFAQIGENIDPKSELQRLRGKNTKNNKISFSQT